MAILFTIIVSCTPEERIQPSIPDVDFYYADISEYSDDFDEIVYKDKEHVLFVSYYSNGLVKEYYCISERDTLALLFSESGMPKVFSDGHSHLVFGDFSNYSALVAILYQDGSCRPYDLEGSINWSEYIETVSTVATKGTRSDALYRHFQSLVFNEVFNQATKIPVFSPTSMTTWIIGAVALTLSDDPTYQSYVNAALLGADYGSLVGSAITKFGLTPQALLIIANYHVWRNVFEQVVYGIENDMFGLPWAREFEYVAKIIEGGVWFNCPDSADLPWDGYSFTIPLKFGQAKFDLYDSNAWDFGIKGYLPEWIDCKPVKNGYNSYISIIVLPNNESKDRNTDLRFFISGVSNIDYDLVFSIHQNRKLQVSSDYINFDKLEPVTIDVMSWSGEPWSVGHCPEWADVDVQGLATDKVRSLTISPKDEEYYDENDNVLILTVSKRQGGTYYAHIMLYYKDPDRCPNQYHPHMIDLGDGVYWSCCNEGSSSPEILSPNYELGDRSILSAPSIEDYIWLINNCTTRRSFMYGVPGIRCKSMINGKSIFLPDGTYFSSTTYSFSDYDYPYVFVVESDGIFEYIGTCSKASIRMCSR